MASCMNSVSELRSCIGSDRDNFPNAILSVRVPKPSDNFRYLHAFSPGSTLFAWFVPIREAAVVDNANFFWHGYFSSPVHRHPSRPYFMLPALRSRCSKRSAVRVATRTRDPRSRRNIGTPWVTASASISARQNTSICFILAMSFAWTSDVTSNPKTVIDFIRCIGFKNQSVNT